MAPVRRSFERTPDAVWVSHLAGVTRAEAASLLREAREDRKFWQEISQLQRGGGREFYAAVSGPYELYAIVRALQPDHVVEVGVSSGVSSSAFLRALQRNGGGTLHSIDRPTPQKGSKYDERIDSPVALPPGMSSGWSVPDSVRQGWDLRIGPSSQLLPSLVQELPHVGVFLHDDEHTFENATFEFETVHPKMREGDVLLADNTAWLGGALDTFAHRASVKARYRKGSDLGGLRIPGPRDGVTGRRSR